MYQYAYIIVVLMSGLLVAGPSFATEIKHQDSVYIDSERLPLSHPEGVACSDSSFVVADTGNSRIVRYQSSVQGVTPEAVFPLPESSPIVVQTNSEGTIYLLDGKKRSIVKMSKDGQMLGQLKPKGINGSQTVIPRSFKLDKAGNVYLLDIFSARVVILDSNENALKELPFPADYGFFSDLAIGRNGQIYLLDSVAGQIYVAASDAEKFDVFSRGLKEYANFPVSLAIAEKGNVYLTDQNGGGLIELAPDGSFQGRKFGMGWEDAQLYYPAQLCINNQNSLVIADRNNNRVQVFSILSN